MTRMMRRNFKSGVCSCRDCCGPEIHGRAAEKREWRRELDADAEFNHRVGQLEVPGWCPIVGHCPEWCAHSGEAC